MVFDKHVKIIRHRNDICLWICCGIDGVLPKYKKFKRLILTTQLSHLIYVDLNSTFLVMKSQPYLGLLRSLMTFFKEMYSRIEISYKTTCCSVSFIHCSTAFWMCVLTCFSGQELGTEPIYPHLIPASPRTPWYRAICITRRLARTWCMGCGHRIEQSWMTTHRIRASDHSALARTANQPH